MDVLSDDFLYSDWLRFYAITAGLKCFIKYINLLYGVSIFIYKLDSEIEKVDMVPPHFAGFRKARRSGRMVVFKPAAPLYYSRMCFIVAHKKRGGPGG